MRARISWSGLLFTLSAAVFATLSLERAAPAQSSPPKLHLVAGWESEGPFRYAELPIGGTWSAFQDIPGQTGWPGYVVSTVWAGATLHVAYIGTDGHIYHSTRESNGVWQPTFFDVNIVVGQLPRVYTLALAGAASGEIHLCVLTEGPLPGGNRLWHTIRHPGGGWDGWGDLSARLGVGGRTFQDIGCSLTTTINPSLHVVVPVDQLGGSFMHHTIRYPDGDWAPLRNITNNAYGGTRVTASAIGADLHVVRLMIQAFRFEHAIRDGNGNWSPFGNVLAHAGPLSPPFRDTWSAAIGNDLHVITLADFRVVHTTRFAGGGWSTWQPIPGTQGVRRASLAAIPATFNIP
jgi:hypothetical protein